MRRNAPRLAVLLLAAALLLTPLSGCSQETVLSRMSQQQCMNTLRRHGFEVTEAYRDWPYVDELAYSLVRHIEAYPFDRGPFGAEYNNEFFDAVRDAVFDYYGLDPDNPPHSPIVPQEE